MTRANLRAVMFVLGCALATAASGAEAASIIRQPGRHDSSVEVELHGIARWYERHALYGGAVGLGLRIGIPIVDNGFIPSINNSVAINFGGDLLFWPDSGGYVNLVIPVALQWSFYLSGSWSVFAEAGVGVEWLPGVPFGRGPLDAWLGFWPGFAAGARYHFGGRAAFPTLTFRVGWPTALNVGFSF